MTLTDINIFIYAFRVESERHSDYLKWLETHIAQSESFGYSDLVLSSFVRIVTNSRIFNKPTRLKDALDFTDAIRGQPNAFRISPEAGHWDIFRRLCLDSGATGGLVPDAYLAALAIESGCEWITADGDFSRFPGLKWRHPLTPA